MTNPFLARDGVVADGGVIQHAGNPVREQRSLDDGSAIVSRDDRVVISITGDERRSWLDSITSQAVGRLRAGESTELLVLDPQGRVEHAAAVVEDGTTLWLIADAADAAPLAKWLAMMRFRAQAEIAVRDDLHVVGVMRNGAAYERVVKAAVREGEAPAVWHDPWTGVTPGGWQYASVAEHPGSDYPWAEAIVADLAPLADLPVAGALAAEALRVAAWRPRWSNEVDERSIPHESDWLRTAVHLDKGCYRGQETVAKVHNLGHPPRRLAMLHLDGSDSVLPARGDTVFDGEREAGQITSSALHHELGPIALAILTRRTPGEATLEVETEGTRVAASQEIIVPADAGRTADVPRLTRLSRRTAVDPPQ